MQIESAQPVLLTGVTGLIGRHVLYELLRESLATRIDREIFVTIRSGDDPAQERLESLLLPGACPQDLAAYATQKLLQNVTLLEVDLVDDHLHETIQANVSDGCCVIHSAASTNLAPSDEAEAEVSANVLHATRRLLEAVTGKAAKFVYIGTSFATGPVSGTITDDYFALETGAARNHYERAKLNTEAYLRDYCEAHDMGWQILRPSVVCGRLFDAPLHYMSKFDVFYGFGKFFHRVLEAGCEERVRILCHDESSLNIVPVDYVAKAIVRSFATPIQQLNIVHNENVNARRLLETVLEAVGYEQFEIVDRMPEDLNPVEELYYATAGAVFSSYITSPAHRYDARRLAVLMEGLNPPDMTAAIPALLDYALDCEFRSAACAAKAAERAERCAPKRVVLVGSGYVSFHAYQSLRRRLRKALRDGSVEIVVVSSTNYHVFHGFVGEVIAGVLPLETVFSPSRQLFEGATFVQGAVRRVDLQGQTICYENAAGDELELGYDELVFATGSENATDRVPGLEAHGQSVRSFATLQHLQQHIVHMLETAESARNTADAQRALTFCVAGGGFTGVEMSAAVAQFLHTCRAHYTVLDHVSPRIVLVHGGNEVLPDLNQKFRRLVRYARKQIARHGIEVRLDTRLTRVDGQGVYFDDGSKLSTRSVISTVGHRPAVMPGTEGCLFDTHRRLVTDRNLNLKDNPNVWTGGDCASIRQPLKRHACPTNALWAIKHGQHIGRNIARKLRGRRPRPFRFIGLGQAASLGDHKGIAELYGIQLTGPLAKVVRLGFFLYYMPNKRNAVQVLFELALRTLFGSKLTVTTDVENRRSNSFVASARRRSQLPASQLTTSGSF